MDISEIGKSIRFQRKTGKLSQKKLADLAGVGKTVIFDIEKGKATVQLDTLLKILSALNISIHLSSALIKKYEES